MKLKWLAGQLASCTNSLSTNCTRFSKKLFVISFLDPNSIRFALQIYTYIYFVPFIYFFTFNTVFKKNLLQYQLILFYSILFLFTHYLVVTFL